MKVEERYISAAHSGNMRVEADRTGDADVMIAAGWCQSRIGMALLRLHSEYDSSQHPRDQKSKWFMHEASLMLMCMKSLPSVREQLTLKAVDFGMGSPQDVAMSVLIWWLDRTCPVCHGQKREVIANTPILSDIVCPACLGSGERKIPCGDAGRQMASFIDESIHAARQSLKKRLHAR